MNKISCRFLTNKIIMILALFILLTLINSESVIAKTIYVDDKGNADFISIHDAIYNANNGDTIIVYSGTYNENIVVTKQLIINGLNNPTINGRIEEQKTISIFNDNVTLNGFIITTSNTSGNTIGIYLQSNNNIIINCSIKDHFRGIYLYRVQNNVLKNNLIYKNNLNAIDVIYSDKNTIENNNISDNINTGLDLISSSNNTIIGNTLKNNSMYGIVLLGGNNILFYNNLINNTIQAKDEYINTWYNITNKKGNYWSDYKTRYSNAIENNGIWSKPYNISYGMNQDLYPLVNKYNPELEIDFKEKTKENYLSECCKEDHITLILILFLSILCLVLIVYLWKKKKK